MREGARQAGAISRCESGPGKAVAGRLEASVAETAATTNTKRTQRVCGVWE
jgi:hypothetical protein